jgi:hypothetical protein
VDPLLSKLKQFVNSDLNINNCLEYIIFGLNWNNDSIYRKATRIIDSYLLTIKEEEKTKFFEVLNGVDKKITTEVYKILV